MKKFSLLWLSTVLILNLLFSSCEVGLGDSVDSEAPKMDITYPEDGSIIMNDFTMSGTCSDDTYVQSIKVRVLTTSDSTLVKEYEGVVDSKANTWSAVINTPEGGTFPLKDADYTFEVTATDSAGRTITKSKLYKIDNTPPVVVIKRPSTDDSYGKTIRLTGDISDTNSLSALYFTVYTLQDDGTLKQVGNTIKKANISGVGLDAIIGKDGDDDASLQKIYNELYESRSSDSDTAILYAVVEFADSAREYTPVSASRIRKPSLGTYSPSEGETLTGNLSTCYYIYDDIYDVIYSDKSTYKLTNSDLISVFNGTHAKSEEVQAVLANYAIETTETTSEGDSRSLNPSKISKFSLNPNNYPYFVLNGGYTYENGFTSITNEAKITVSISKGRDQISLKTDTIRLALDECDSTGNELYTGDAQKENEIVLMYSQDEINAMTDANAKTAAQNVLDASLTKGDTVTIACSIGKRITKRYYKVRVDGTDLDGNQIEPSDGNIYGFLVQSNSRPPVVDIEDGTEDLTVLNTTEFNYSGTVSSNSDAVYFYYYITAKDEKGSSTLGSTPDLDNGEKGTQIVLTSEGDSTSLFDWSLGITPLTIGTALTSPSDSLYMYSITFYAEDSDGNRSELKTRRVHIDKEKPSVVISNITPIAVAATSSSLAKVNETITVTGNISDNYSLKDTVYKVYNSSDSSKVLQTGSFGENTTFSFEINTKDSRYTDNTDITVELVATDKAANQSSAVTRQVRIDQSTDNPVITLNNADISIKSEKDSSGNLLITESKNLFDQTSNNKILGTITDDDALYSVVAYYRKASSTSESDFKQFFAKSAIDSSTFTLTLPLVDSNTAKSFDEGVYEIRIVACDNKSNPATTTTSFVVAVDTASPVISITSQQNSYKTTDFSVVGTVQDGSGTVTLSREKRSGETSDVSVSLNAVQDKENTWSWEDKITAKDAGETLSYVAVDKYGRKTTATFAYKVDKNAPEMAFTAIDAEEITNETDAAGNKVLKYLSKSTHRFKGTVYDDKKEGNDTDSSGIETITFQLKYKDDDGNWQDVTDDGSGEGKYTLKENSTYIYDWTANVLMGDLDVTKEYTIEFVATDGAGNKTSVESAYTYKIDSEEPTSATKYYTYDGKNFAETTGTIYSNNTKDLTVYGTVSDIVSGVKSIKFEGFEDGAVTYKYATNTVTDTTTGDDFNGFEWSTDIADGTKVTAWKAVIKKEKIKTGTISETHTDNANNSATEKAFTIVSDTKEPSINNITINGDGSYNSEANTYYIKPGKYTLKGVTTDDYGIQNTSYVIDSGETVEISTAQGSWEKEIDLSSYTTDGKVITIKVTALDIAGNTKKVSLTATVDTVAPELNRAIVSGKGKDRLFLAGGGKHRPDTYGNSVSITVNGSYAETGSGIAAVYYKVLTNKDISSVEIPSKDSSTDETIASYEANLISQLNLADEFNATNYESKADGRFTVIANNDSAKTIKFEAVDYKEEVNENYEYPKNAFTQNLSGFKESQNTNSNILLLLAVDNCGNVSSTVSAKVLNVDTTAPVFSTEANTSRIVLTNGSEVVIENENFYVEDSASGISSITSSVGTVTEVTKDDTSAKKKYFKVTVSADAFSSLSSGNIIVKVTAKDAAGGGNENFTNIATITLDKTAPEVSVNTPTANSTVNGKISISGTASDNNEIKSVKLYTSIKASDAAADVETYTKDEKTYYFTGNSFEEKDCYNWTAQNIDTTKFTGEIDKDNEATYKKDISILIVGEDKAGNKVEVIREIKIDQKSDQPDIKFTNIDEKVEAANITKVLKTNIFGTAGTTIFGSVSDDDGISYIGYKIDNATEWTQYYQKGESETAVTSQAISLNLDDPITSGLHTLKFKVTDIKNETIFATHETSAINFAYDKESPTISISSINEKDYSAGGFLPSAFNIVGSASDDSEVKSVTLKGSATNLWNSDTKTWSDSVTGQTDTAAGKSKTITYVVTDKFGYTAETSVTYQVDTKAPVFNTYAKQTNVSYRDGNHRLIINGGDRYFTDTSDTNSSYHVAKDGNWFNQKQITITGSVTEVNLREVTLVKDGDTSNASKQINKNFAFSESFEDGVHSFTITATDEAGQTAQLGAYTLRVDSTSPTISSVSVKQKDGTTEFTEGTVINSYENIKITISAEDKNGDLAVSGVAAVYLGTSANPSASECLMTINASDLSSAREFIPNSLSDGTYTLYARAIDNAGNYSASSNVTSFVVDNTAPATTISSPATGRTVNKTFTISGSVQESNIVDGAVPTLYIKEKASGSWAQASTDSVPDVSYSSGSWSLTFDSTKYTDEKEYYIGVAFTDKAGNVTDYTKSTHVIKVSQDSDRPTIIFPNVAFTTDISLTDRIWLTNEQVSGTVTDDDGVSAVYMIVKEARSTAPSATDDGWGSDLYSSSSGMWTASFTGNEGSKDIYFKVVDSASGVFISSYKKTNDITAPKLKYNNVILGESANYSTILYSKVDLTAPVIEKTYYTTTSVTSLESLFNGNTLNTESLTALSELTKEGGTDKTIYIISQANDANGIESMSLSVGGKSYSSKGTKIVDDNYYALFEIPLSNSDFNGYIQKLVITITAKDNASKTTSYSKEISIDNLAPESEFITSSTWFYGTASDNKIIGATSDNSNIQHLYVGFSNSATERPTYSNWTDIISNVSYTRWTIAFDGVSNNNTDNIYHFKKLNDIIDEVYGSYISTNQGITEKPLYVWVYAVDAYGNGSADSAVSCLYTVYTQGDKPTVTVSYPTTGASVGGTIRITGSSKIAIDSVSGVYVQIDPSYENSFDDNWETELKTLIDTRSVGYSVIESGNTTIGNAIKAEGIESWNLTINALKEFDTTDSSSNRSMAIRVYALSNTEGKASEPVVVPFTLDPGAPTFGNSDGIKVTKYNSDNKLESSRVYESGMWINGQCYLEVDVEDDSGIKNIIYTPTYGSAVKLVLNQEITSGYTDWVTKVNNTINYKLKIPVGSSTQNVFGTNSFTLEAFENSEDYKSTKISVLINYDNKAPEFTNTTLKSDVTNTIVQSDGMYSMEGTFIESSSNSSNQSGFERIAFYFTREWDNEQYIVDPMIQQGSSGTDNSYKIDSSIVKTDEDGLYWRTAKAQKITSDGVITVTPPENVRVGGLCKIDNVIYRIKTVSSISVKLEGSLTATEDEKDVYFAIAQVIDNTIKETAEAITFAGDTSNVITNDDGDEMIDYYIENTSKWSVGINSKNIKDGAVKVHFVAFDKAGNKATADYNAIVSNNAPRIAGISFGTDLTGKGSVSDDEMRQTYSGLFNATSLNKKDGVTENGRTASGNSVSTLAIPHSGSAINVIPDGAKSVMTVKGVTKFAPEIVGGNDGLGYTYTVDGKTSTLTELNTIHSATDDIRDTSTTEFSLSVADLINATNTDGEKDFNLTLWDYTKGMTAGTDSNKANFIIRLNFAVRDTENPVASIKPFYWNSATDNSVYAKVNGASSASIQGHIELESDLPDTFKVNLPTTEDKVYDRDPKVSGIIVIEGTARDNVIVNELYMKFPGLATSATNSFGNNFALFAKRNESGIWEAQYVSLATEGLEVLSITEEQDDEEYNVVTWKVAVDTSKITNVADRDVEVEVQAKDRGAASVSGSSVTYAPHSSDSSTVQTTSASNTPYYKMDIVPYITSISTPNRSSSGLKDNNIRSASGKYSIIKGSTSDFIEVNGFNLKPGTSDIRIVDSTTAKTTGVTTSSGTDLSRTTAADSTYTSFKLSNNISKSGYLEVFTNGVRTLNNINSDDAKGGYTGNAISDWANYYNREPDYYTTKNVQLTDDRYLLLFDMHTAQTPSGSNTWKDLKNAYYPVMLMNGDNPVFGYMNGSGGPSVAAGTNRGTGAGTYQASHAMPQRAEFNGTSGAEVYTEYLIKASAWDGMGMAVDEGGRYYNVSSYNRDGAAMSLIYDRYAEVESAYSSTTNYSSGMGWGAGTGYSNYGLSTSGGNNWKASAWSWGANNNAITLETVNYSTGVLLGRYMYPKLIANGNSKTGTAKVYMAYYDDGTGEIAFRNFQLGNSVTGTSYTLDSSHKDISGTTYAQSVNFLENRPESYTGGETYNSKNYSSLPSESYSIGRLQVVASGSKYYDMGITNDNHVVIIYYDENASCLKLVYSTNAVDGSTPTATVAWTSSSVTFPSYAGTYCSMAIDASGGIHIASFDASDADLKYFYLPSYSSTSLTTCTVDSAGSVGHWTGIAICTNSENTELNGKPVISYYNSTETGTRESIKLAYPKAAIGSIEAGVDANGYTTGNWDYMTVPAITPPQGGDSKFQKVCLGFDTKGIPVIGYCGTNLEFGKQLSE